MTTMNQRELREHVLERLANSDSRNDIILETCERTGMGWGEAEAFVNQVQTENQSRITLQQSPLLVLLAFAIFIAGAGLIVYSVTGVVATFETFRVASNDDFSSLPQGIVFIWYMAAYAPEMIGSLVLGAGMIIGSLRGMQSVWEAVFERVGLFQRIK